MINKFNNRKTKMLKYINFVLSLIYHTPKDDSPLDFSIIKNILIIDPNMIGDMVMLEPVLRIIKANIPEAKITLVCSKWAETIFRNENLVDKYVFVTKPAFTNQWTNKDYKIILNNALTEINKITYDLALEPRGDLRYIYFMSKCKARRKISYNYTGGECLLTDVIIPSDRVEHLLDDKLYFLEQLNFKFNELDRYPKLHLSSDDIEGNQQFLLDNQFEGKYVVGIHPGASLKIKQWKHYPELTRRIIGTYKNCAIILFEGPGEKEIVDKVVNEIDGCIVPVVRSKTDISTYMRLLALCNLVICNDSGAGHIAAAYGDRVITIFGPVLPSLAKPYGENVVAVSDDSFGCKPCISSECYRNCECIDSISVDDVFEAFKESMEQ